MNKKSVTIFIIFILTTTMFSSITCAESTQQPLTTQQINSPPIATFTNDTHLTSMGPVTPWLNVDNIVIISGPYFKTFIIRLILVSLKAYFLIPDISIPINDLTFAIRYNWNIPPSPFLQRWSYNTTITNNGNTTTYTNRHVLLVSGFDGTFGFNRADILNMMPAQFRFEGTCDGVLVVN
jgi:hypothetical protein